VLLSASATVALLLASLVALTISVVLIRPAGAQEEPLPDLVANKECPATVESGGHFTCTISMTNQGTAPAIFGPEQFVLQDAVWGQGALILAVNHPSGYSYENFSYGPGGPDVRGLWYQTAPGYTETIDPGETLSGFSVEVQAPESGTIMNCAFADSHGLIMENPEQQPEDTPGSNEQNNETCVNIEVVNRPPPPREGPKSKDECKHGGYATFGFKNQGQCIRSVG